MFEAAVGILVVLGVLHGARRGLVRQSAGLASVIGAMALGIPLSKELAPLVDLRSPMNRTVAFAVVVIGISLIFYLLADAIRKVLIRRDLKTWDSLAGALFGAFKGFALATILTVFVLAKKEEWRPVVQGSKVARVMSDSLAAIHPYWPPEIRPLVHPYVHYLDIGGPGRN